MKVKRICIVGLLGFLTLCQASCTSTPTIDSLDPDTGPERTLVSVVGDTFLATAFWDAGSASEQSVTGAMLGAHLFTVPAGASVDDHPVQLERGSTRGNEVLFTVTDPLPITPPRLDRVSIVSADFPTAADVNAILLVQGANVDVNAEVLIDGVVVPTAAYKGMQNYLYAVNPDDLAFPIYHYLAVIVGPGVYPLSTTIGVSIRNADGQVSNALQYTLPASEDLLDSDGDDIPDDWEINGYDEDGDGIIDIDLPALGADPLRPDIFLEVDVMQGLTNPPTADVWTAVTDAFANAPIINAGLTDGVNLVLDTSGSVAHYDIINFVGTTTLTAIVFNDMKSAEFDDTIRGRIYHYCVWGDMRPNGSSGLSDVVWGDGGDDCIVSFDDFAAGYQTVQSMAETLMHELGHNLNQRHGGTDDTEHNPTYSSVMSYSWQLRTGRSNVVRLANNIYAPFYYQIDGVVEVGGAVPPAATGVAIDYSAGMGRVLVESDLDETVGLYNNNPVYWNVDFDQTDTSANRDLNDDFDTDDTLVDYSNWANLIYTGPRTNGSN